MAIQISDDVANDGLEAVETRLGASPTLEIRTGPPPATCAASDTGTGSIAFGPMTAAGSGAMAIGGAGVATLQSAIGVAVGSAGDVLAGSGITTLAAITGAAVGIFALPPVPPVPTLPAKQPSRAAPNLTAVPVLRRDSLMAALNGDRALVAAFEQQVTAIGETQEEITTGAGETKALQDATFVTLGPNAVLTAERVLRMGVGVTMVDDGTYLTISVNDEVPKVEGGFSVQLVAQTESVLVLPEAGTLATQSQPETLRNKTLATPKVSAITDYADDTAAAAGGVPVGGVYRTGSALMIRVA